MTHPVVAAARAYLGVRFRHQGRSRHGLDCVGLLLLAFRDVGRVYRDVPAYGRTPWKDGLREAVASQLQPVPLDDMQPGDVALIRFDKEPQHVALIGDYLTGGLSLIHSYAIVRRVTEQRLDEAWRANILEVYR